MHIRKSQRKRIENYLRRLRIELLAKPRERKMKPWPDPAVYRSLPCKVPRSAMLAIPSEQILRLYTSKKDFTHKPPSMCIEPGHYVSQYALKAVATSRVVNLAKPKRLHKPPPPPPKTKRQIKREKELRNNLDEAMKRLSRPPRTEVVKKPEPELEPEPPAEPQPPPPAAKKPPVAGQTAPAGTARAGGRANMPQTTTIPVQPAPTAGAGRAGGRANVPQTTTIPAQPAPAAASAPMANPRGKRPSVPTTKITAPTVAAPDTKAAKQKDQQPTNVATTKKK